MLIRTRAVRAKIREVRTDEDKFEQRGFGVTSRQEGAPRAKQHLSIDQHEKKIGITGISSNLSRASYDHTPYRGGRGCGDRDLFQP